MKIGILTWYYGANYGAKAQAYALNHVVSHVGHTVQMVNYKTNGFEKVNIGTNLNVERAKHHPVLYLKCLWRVKNFWEVNKYFNESIVIRKGEDVDSLGLDCVIFGSDAIFNVNHKLFEKIYMGVGIKKTKKVSYAPSCEDLNPNYKLSKECIDSLRQFSNVSVRDENTKRLLKNNVGIDAVEVLDPTLLYDFVDISTRWDEKDYILIYTFSDWSIYQKQIQLFAKDHGLKIIAVGRYCKWAYRSYTAASFEQWICSFRKATYVLTDSFHGTVFSIKNNKQMILCSRPDKRAKIESLLNDARIQRKFYDGKESIETYLQAVTIDYQEVNQSMKKLVDFSMAYLQKSLADNVDYYGEH